MEYGSGWEKEGGIIIYKISAAKTRFFNRKKEEEGDETLLNLLKEYYQGIFQRRWPTWLGGLLLGFTNVLMFAYARPWGTADGIRVWGDWLLRLLGLSFEEPPSPLLYSTSVLNISLMGGSFMAALLAGEFAIRYPSLRELSKGFMGGIFMGIGATLSMGCNIGGFLSALSALSASGLGMMLGLILGSYIGLRYLLWELNLPSAIARVRRISRKPSRWAYLKPFQPYFGGILFLFTIALVFGYDFIGYSERGGLLLFGTSLGIICQRSRICFVKAFREPFMTGDAKATRAVILAAAVSVVGFSIIKWNDFRDATIFVYPAFWLGSVLGGVIFGIGMVLAGGCGAGSLWRAGEGQVKLCLAVIGFALAGSIFRNYAERIGLINKLGKAVFIPDYLGWEIAIILALGILSLWFLLVSWNQIRGRFSLMT